MAAAGVPCQTIGPSRSSITARIGVPLARVRAMRCATASATAGSPGRW